MLQKNPEGYRKLLVYQKAQTLHGEILDFVLLFPKTKTFIDLADQISRSMRSTEKNLVEGWKRTTTKEYFDFLSFSIGSNSEMMEDLADIATGLYKELMGIKGIMGETPTQGSGSRGVMGTPSSPYSRTTLNQSSPPAPSGSGHAHSSPYSRTTLNQSSPPAPSGSGHAHSSPYSRTTPFPSYPRNQLDTLKFYPLDETLPPAVKLFLKSKEISLLLYKLQNSLDLKMDAEHTKPANQRAKDYLDDQKQADKDMEKYFEAQGLVRLENGQYITKEEWEQKGKPPLFPSR